MQKYLERRAYSRLKTWKEDSRHAMLPKNQYSEEFRLL